MRFGPRRPASARGGRGAAAAGSSAGPGGTRRSGHRAGSDV